MTDVGLVQGLIIVLLFSVAGCLTLCIGRRHNDSLRFQIRVFLVAIAIRFALSVAIYQFGLVQYVGDEDASGWSAGANLSRDWSRQGVSILELPFRMTEAFHILNRGYTFLLGGLFFVTGSPFRLVAAALNAFVGAATVVFAYRVARTLFSDWVANHVAWWTVLFPSMLIWSALTVKEPTVIFLETLALYGCVRLRESGLSPRHLVLCGACIVFLIPFRFYAAYLVAFAVIISLTASSIVRPKRAFAGLLLLASLVPIVLASGSLARRESRLESFDLSRVQRFRENVSAGGTQAGAGSGVRTVYDVRTPGGLAGGVAVGAVHLLLAPFPWQLGGGSVRMVATLPELVYWWWLVFAGLVPGVAFCVRRRLADVLATLMFIGGFGLLYSMMFGNVGLIFRQRAQLLPWLFIFAAVGLEQRLLRRRVANPASGVQPSRMPEVNVGRLATPRST